MDEQTTTLELEKINKNNIYNDLSENISDSDKSTSPFRKQAISAMGVIMFNLGAGATSGISAILIPQLMTQGVNFSTEMMSWVAAISCLALFFGNLMSGYLMERFGRRVSQLLLAASFTSGWLIIGLADGMIYLILLGRFITGLCQGWLGPLGPVFVGEISTPKFRGFFLAALSLGIAAGVLISHLLGTFLHWSTASFLCGLFPFIGGIIIYYTPESPAWLASKDRIEECIDSFRWYRGNNSEMKSELNKMIAEQSKKTQVQSKIKTLFINIKKPEFWKPLSIMTVFFLITQLSGINVVCAYTTVMMMELLGRGENDAYASWAMLSIDILRCIALVIACILLRRSGRRPVAIFSAVFTSLSLITLAVYMYLYKTNVISHMSPVVSLGLMAIYIIASHLGISPLPWNMVGELFAVETKGLGSGVSVMMTSIAFFTVVKTAPAMFLSIGHHGAYMFYGLSTLLGSIFLYFCLPETKNKTLLEIEDQFKYGKKTELEESKNLKA